ncbi:hypothetical protein LFL97_29295 [Burkholderia sp. JSH-S8]|nr:hypothetical protein [Burkholderia stagnalis]WGS44681.1 hypothetical protein LFL97_29295 [Burkholderia sp. JSH-S8]
MDRIRIDAFDAETAAASTHDALIVALAETINASPKRPVHRLVVKRA